MLRIVFMGSPIEVVPPLRQLRELSPSSEMKLVAVVSQPARPFGRGGKLQDPPVALYAKENSIPCFQPESAREPEFLAELRNLSPDIIVTAAYGQILSDDFLKIPRIGTINIHPSRLPKYRGATPVPAALLDGLTTTAVTILFTVKRLDAGNIILQKDFVIDPNETAGSLTSRLFAESGNLLLDSLSILARDPNFKGTPQSDADASFCKKIDKEMGAIDWSLESGILLNRFRAFEPWPGSWTIYGDKRITVTEMVIAPSGVQTGREPGLFSFDKTSKSLVVNCGKGALAIRKVKPAGGKEMDAASFWNGLKDKSQLTFVTAASSVH